MWCLQPVTNSSLNNPAIAPPMLRFAKQSMGGGTVVQQPLGGRDACLPPHALLRKAKPRGRRQVAPLGADVQVPRALPVGLHMFEFARADSKLLTSQ